MELADKFLDYGVGIGALAICLYFVLRWFIPKTETTISEIKEKTAENTDAINALTKAVTEQTVNMTNLMDTCKSALEDNRVTIDILIKYITGKPSNEA